MGWFQDIMNWEFDPFFNYQEVYNVSAYNRVPKWSPEFAFHGSGSRFASPGSSSFAISAIQVIANATDGVNLEPIDIN